MSQLADALRQFDATESNLKRLEDLWTQIKKLIPDGLSIGGPDAPKHAELCRAFRHILSGMPKLDGFELTDDLLDIDTIFKYRFDAKELGEIFCEINVENSIYKQAEMLSEYRFRLSAQRRQLIRTALGEAIKAVDELLIALDPHREREAADAVNGEHWQSLKVRIAEIDVLKGTSIKSPPRWADLHRHLTFGLVQDLCDIISKDWPAAKLALEADLYGPTDPIPVSVPDLAALVKAAPRGPIVTALNWENIDATSFERLVFNLVSQAEGYNNANWLMHTYAADRGRDVAVERTVADQLTGTRNFRVIVQCKHWQSKSIGIQEVTALIAQMQLWEPPKVDELIIATTGTFTVDAVAYIEKRNNDRQFPAITMWSHSHLELLLAERPHLVTEFGLR
ncbi:MAG: restriction endonuclease [Phycisphaerae bacterium]|nr:restriction endonuclease [Phycisphaerae bacterium]